MRKSYNNDQAIEAGNEHVRNRLFSISLRRSRLKAGYVGNWFFNHSKYTPGARPYKHRNLQSGRGVDVMVILLILIYTVIWALVALNFGLWGLLLGWIVPEVFFRLISAAIG